MLHVFAAQAAVTMEASPSSHEKTNYTDINYHTDSIVNSTDNE